MWRKRSSTIIPAQPIISPSLPQSAISESPPIASTSSLPAAAAALQVVGKSDPAALRAGHLITIE